MTKLQSIVSEIKALPVDEQRELASLFVHLIPKEDDIFELTEAELAEIDDLLINDTESFTMKEVFDPLFEKYGQSHTA